MHLRTARPNGSAWFVLVLTLMFAGERLAAEEHWARFRGPAGTGIHEAKGFPVKWTQNDYAWKTPIPGVGHSSPCVWGDHVFLTTALYDGRKRATLAYSAATGKLLWQDDFASKSHEKHVLNSYASATPACDGQRVYTLFTNDDQVLVRALDMDGKLVWQEDLGRFFNRHNHGCGTSPIVFEDSVILSIQHDGESYVVALDSATGKERWRNRRQSQLTGHATPAVIQEEGDEPRLLFTNTGDGVASLDPRTGKLQWRANVFQARAVGSPIVGHGLVFATCGGGGKGRYLAGLPLRSKGEVTDKDAAWVRERELPYVPTPVVYGDNLYLWGDNGVVVCVKVKTGEDVWKKRVGGVYSSSPVCVGGKLYCISRSGEVVTLATGDEFRLLGRTLLGEGCHATPAIADGRMFIRGFKHLLCLKAK